jgi:hypothetical protein
MMLSSTSAVARTVVMAIERNLAIPAALSSLTYSSSLSIVREAPVGIFPIATSRAALDTTPMHSLAAFPDAALPSDVVLSTGVVLPTLRGFAILVDVASSTGLSSLSDGITSGPFASAAAFAVARRGGFARRLTPSRFEETRGIFPSAVFWRFPAAGPPSTAGLPSLAPAVLPTPVLWVGLIFGAIVGAILFNLDLACLVVLLGKIMMSQDVHFRGSWKRKQELVLFYTSSRVEF